jgi:SIR2-like domain
VSIQSIVEWITDQDTCFLLGAGCSLCANKPGIDKLTMIVKGKLSTPGQKLLDDLKGTEGRPANIEDLVNYLLRLRLLAESRKTPLEQVGWERDSIDQELAHIQKAVVEAVGLDWKPSSYHQRFLTRLVSGRPRKPIDIFSLNYDTVLEASLEMLKLRYTDGFVGSENAYFSPTVFEEIPADVPFFRIHKLHGSVNWIKDNDDTIRRRPVNSLGDAPRAVVYPAEQKHLQTQFGIYDLLMRRFRERLRDNNTNTKLIVLGYSFRDEHINVAIEDSIRTGGGNLTVYAFIGPEGDCATQKTRFETMAKRCDHRFNVIIGDNCHVGPALDEAGWKELVGKELWKFEKLICLLTGATDEH